MNNVKNIALEEQLKRARVQRYVCLESLFRSLDEFVIPSTDPETCDRYERLKRDLLENYGYGVDSSKITYKSPIEIDLIEKKMGEPKQYVREKVEQFSHLDDHFNLKGIEKTINASGKRDIEMEQLKEELDLLKIVSQRMKEASQEMMADIRSLLNEPTFDLFEKWTNRFRVIDSLDSVMNGMSKDEKGKREGFLDHIKHSLSNLLDEKMKKMLDDGPSPEAINSERVSIIEKMKSGKFTPKQVESVMTLFDIMVERKGGELNVYHKKKGRCKCGDFVASKPEGLCKHCEGTHPTATACLVFNDGEEIIFN